MKTWTVYGAAVTAAVAAALALALPPGAAAEPGKQKYILALGDSETAGTQAVAPAVVLGGSPETEVNRSGAGYADQLASRLESQGLRADLVNLACYYETTDRMIEGGSLCTYPHGTQLAEAEQFLHAHGEDVRAVVMSIGANDMLRNCPVLFDVGCYSEQLAIAGANLATILARLRAAGGDIPIAIVNYHDPFLALWFLDPALARLSVPLIVEPLSQMVRNASAPFDVVFVDTLAAFRTDNFTDTVFVPGVGLVPVNVALICAHSWMCTHNDIHLNTSGYALVAQEVARALGLGS
jgi:lysophospholipase L1-like esterase